MRVSDNGRTCRLHGTDLDFVESRDCRSVELSGIGQKNAGSRYTRGNGRHFFPSRAFDCDGRSAEPGQLLQQVPVLEPILPRCEQRFRRIAVAIEMLGEPAFVGMTDQDEVFRRPLFLCGIGL